MRAAIRRVLRHRRSWIWASWRHWSRHTSPPRTHTVLWVTRPFFKARLEYVDEVIPQMEGAIRSHNFEQIGKLAELDTLLLHGITMTGVDELFLWRPETVSIILEVKKMRKEGLDCYFSIDTGATVYINSHLEDVDEVARRINAIGVKVLKCHVGDEAKIVNEHLF